MDKLKYIRIQQEDDQYYGDVPIGVDAENVDLKNGSNLQEVIGDYDYTEQGSLKEKFDSINNNISSVIDNEANVRHSADATLENQINVLRTAIGSPLVASTVAEMTDKTRVYVYVGKQSGYVNGNWYYWNGSAWASGGIYNSTAFQTDKTLSILNSIADAKIVGNNIEELINNIKYYSEDIQYNVVDNYYINGITGRQTASKNWRMINWVNVSKYDAIQYNIPTNTTAPDHPNAVVGMGFYSDTNANSFISGELIKYGYGQKGSTFHFSMIPEGAKYIRLSEWNDDSIEGVKLKGVNLLNSQFKNKMGYLGELTSSDKISDCYKTGFYYTLLNNTPIDAPQNATGFCLIFSYGDDPQSISNTSICNIYITYYGKIYFRQKTKAATDFGAWYILDGNLKKFVIQPEGSLPNSQDMNELFKPGIYNKLPSYSWSNYPSDLKQSGQQCVILVFSGTRTAKENLGVNSSYLFQIIFHVSNIYYRYHLASTEWTEWSAISRQSLIRLSTENSNKIAKSLEQVKRSWIPKNENMKKIKHLSDEVGVPSQYEFFDLNTTYNFIPYSGMIQCGRDVFHDRNLATFFSAVENPASTLYQPLVSEGRYQGTNYGAICSSFSAWLAGDDIYRGTSQLQNYLNFYDYHGPEDVEIGDVLLFNNTSGGHIKTIVGINVDSESFVFKQFVIADQNTSRIQIMNQMDFEQHFANGYIIGRYPNAHPHQEPAVRYATDIIAEMGNNTYYYNDDQIWLYIADETVNQLYYKKDDGAYTKILKSSLTSKEINDVTVYNVTPLMANTGKYYFSTNPSLYHQVCELLKINTGNINVNDTTVTLSNYSDNLQPRYYQIMTIRSGTADSTVYPAPEGNYRGGRLPNSETYITENTFTITKPTQSGVLGFYVRVYYKNEFGLAYKDSNFIMY